MRRWFVAIAFCALLQPATAYAQSADNRGHWSNIDRETTIQRVSEEVAAASARFQREVMAAANDPDDLQKAIADAVAVLLGLRDFLAQNPFVRLNSFSVGIPSGLTVEFTFPSEG